MPAAGDELCIWEARPVNTVSTLEPTDTAVIDRPIEIGFDDELLEDELLVEEISIDGMCGVY